MPRSPETRSSSLLPFGFVLIGALLALYFAVVLRSPRAGFGESHPAVGSRLHTLSLEPLVNTEQGLQLESLSGKVVLINYWGPWCKPCRIEMPYLVELQQEFADENDFRFVSVSCGIQQVYADLPELRRATGDYAQRARMDFPIFADPRGDSRAGLAETARIANFGYPTSVLLDRDHTIRALWEGYTDGVDVEMKAVALGVLRGD